MSRFDKIQFVGTAAYGADTLTFRAYREGNTQGWEAVSQGDKVAIFGNDGYPANVYPFVDVVDAASAALADFLTE